MQLSSRKSFVRGDSKGIGKYYHSHLPVSCKLVLIFLVIHYLDIIIKTRVTCISMKFAIALMFLSVVGLFDTPSRLSNLYFIEINRKME